MLGVLGSCFEFERALMLDRQRIGIAFAKKEGKFKGKPHAKKPENFDVFAEKYLRATRFDRYPFKEFLKDVGLKSSLARKFLKTYKENKIKENESKNLIETNIQKI
jgi:DNA invertase Pin-like site-specific DNA recombinase